MWDLVRQTVNEHGMFTPRDGLALAIVGVSGGPDSTVLLHVLAALAPEFGLRLHVAHLNHGFRGAEAAADADYVEVLAGELGCAYTGGFCDVPALAAADRLSAQNAARRARYQFFRDTGERFGARYLALAHTLDDQAETVLMRLLRGAGSGGLSGIPPVRSEGSLTVVRPLIRATREEIEAYCLRHGLSPRLDRSNLKPVYLRNRVRLQVLPELRRVEPRVAQHLAQTAEILAAEDAVLDDQAGAAFERLRHLGTEPGGPPTTAAVVLPRAALLDLPLALQRRVIRLAHAVAVTGGEGPEGMDDLEEELDFAHVEKLRRVLTGQAGLLIQLPGGVEVVTEYDRMVMRRNHAAPRHPEGWVREIQIPGLTPIPELGLAIRAEIQDFRPDQADAGLQKRAKVAQDCALDYNRIAMPLLVRTRRSGDRFQPFGMPGTKKLADFFVDEHVPKERRDRIPIVVTAGDDLVWVGGYRLADNYRVTPVTSTALFLTLVPFSPPSPVSETENAHEQRH